MPTLAELGEALLETFAVAVIGGLATIVIAPLMFDISPQRALSGWVSIWWIWVPASMAYAIRVERRPPPQW